MLNKHYAILGVDEDASAREIQDTFYELALRYHSDLNPGDQHAQERFDQICLAFKMLKDPENRLRAKADGSEREQTRGQGDNFTLECPDESPAPMVTFNEAVGGGLFLLIAFLVGGPVIYYSYISGSSMGPFIDILYFLLVFFCAIAIGFAIWEQIVIIREIDSAGIVAQGIIIDKWKKKSGRRFALYYVSYRFGDDFEAYQQVKSSLFKELQLGDMVTIRFLPQKPTVSRVEWNT